MEIKVENEVNVGKYLTRSHNLSEWDESCLVRALHALWDSWIFRNPWKQYEVDWLLVPVGQDFPWVSC